MDLSQLIARRYSVRAYKPDLVEPILFTPLGYPATQPEPKERKPLTKLVGYEHWD